MEGKVFNRLTVAGLAHRDAKYNKYWNCLCTCGKVTVVRGDRLTAGDTQSCGCLRKNNSTKKAHEARSAIAKIERKTYTRDSYKSMIRRCYEPKLHPGYYKYGGRGVEVCDRWRFGEGDKNGFNCFHMDMGPRPQGKTIDRIDGTKGYFPQNCRWATPKEQAANRKPPTLKTKPHVKKFFTKNSQNCYILPP
jgi:hypothetical protein